MVIRFECACGRKLKARDKAGGCRTLCPACHEPVAVPRRAAAETDSVPISPSAAPSRRADGARERPSRGKRERISLRKLPKWKQLQSRSDPQSGEAIGSVLLALCRLTVAPALLVSLVIYAWPRLAQLNQNEILIPMLCLSIPLLVTAFSYSCADLKTLTADNWFGSRKKKTGRQPKPTDRPAAGGLRWLVFVMCGPSVATFAACQYWLYCGDMTPIDWMIVIELLMAAVAWWLVSFAVSFGRTRKEFPTPAVVVATALRMGWRLLAMTVPATLLLMGLFLCCVASVMQLHESPVAGGCLIWLCWTCGLGCAVLCLNIFERTAESVGLNCRPAVARA